jgi:hypothetical protein
MVHRLPGYVSLLMFWPIDVVVTRPTRLTKLSGSAPLDNYKQPLLAPEDWFPGLHKLVKRVLDWGGEQEVLIDTGALRILETHVATFGHEDAIMTFTS